MEKFVYVDILKLHLFFIFYFFHSCMHMNKSGYKGKKVQALVIIRYIYAIDLSFRNKLWV